LVKDGVISEVAGGHASSPEARMASSPRWRADTRRALKLANDSDIQIGGQLITALHVGIRVGEAHSMGTWRSLIGSVPVPLLKS